MEQAGRGSAPPAAAASLPTEIIVSFQKKKKRDENRKKQHRIPTEFPVSGLPGCLDTTNPYPTMREGACFTARSAWDRLLARCHGLLCCNLDWSGQSPLHPVLCFPKTVGLEAAGTRPIQ